MHERRVSGRLLSALFEKGLKGSVTPQLVAHLAAEGVEVGKWKAHYPYATWVRVLELTAGELFGGEVLSDALRKLGGRVVETLKDSELNGPLLTMGKLMGPKRILKQVSGQMIRGADFLKVEVEEKGGKHVEVHLNDGAIGDFLAGGLEAALEALGAREPKVAPLELSPHRCVLDVRWG